MTSSVRVRKGPRHHILNDQIHDNFRVLRVRLELVSQKDQRKKTIHRKGRCFMQDVPSNNVWYGV